MPVVRSLTQYRRSNGKRVRLKLYASWLNMRGRIQGHQYTGRGGARVWAGLETDFTSWADFRAWALSHGYGRVRCSLDRERSTQGYLKENLRWVTKQENSAFATFLGNKRRSDRQKQRRINALAYI